MNLFASYFPLMYSLQNTGFLLSVKLGVFSVFYAIIAKMF